MFISFTADFSRALLTLLEGKILYCRSLLVYLLFLNEDCQSTSKMLVAIQYEILLAQFLNFPGRNMTTTSLPDFATHPLILRKKSHWHGESKIKD